MKKFTASLVIAVAFIANGLTVLAADEGAKGKEGEKEADKGKEETGDNAKRPPKAPADAGAGLAAFGKVLPLGLQNLDVRIPSFRDGVPNSTMRAQTLTRVDDNHIAMNRLDIRLIDNVRQNDLRVQMPTATFDMSANVLSSEDRSRVSREDFQIEGDTLTFDTNSGQGKMTGHIHMIIYDVDSMKKKPEPAAAPKGDAAAPAQGAKPNPTKE